MLSPACCLLRTCSIEKEIVRKKLEMHVITRFADIGTRLTDRWMESFNASCNPKQSW